MADGTQVGAQRLQSSLRGPLILPQASRGGCPMEPSVQVGRQTESPDHLGGWRSQTHSVSRSAGQGGNLCPRGQRGSASAVGGENGGEQLSRFTPLCESRTGPSTPSQLGPGARDRCPGSAAPSPPPSPAPPVQTPVRLHPLDSSSGPTDPRAPGSPGPLRAVLIAGAQALTSRHFPWPRPGSDHTEPALG